MKTPRHVSKATVQPKGFFLEHFTHQIGTGTKGGAIPSDLSLREGSKKPTAAKHRREKPGEETTTRTYSVGR